MDDLTDATFQELMVRVRAGDQAAALEMHQLFGEHVQRIIRVRMTNQGLRRQMDSMDICQSVFADFFVRMALGQYDLNSPSDLMRLLATMARNRLFHHSDKQRAARRDVRRVVGGPIEELGIAASDGTPSAIVSAKELYAQVDERLSDEEKMVAQARRDGRSWEEIGELTQQTPEAMRKRWERVRHRVIADLGMEDFGDAQPKSSPDRPNAR